MGMFKEFREFAMKGNLVDMAVAFVMGAAFGKVVTGFIDGIVMPFVGKIVSGVNFQDLKYVLSPAVFDGAGKEIQPESAVLYGQFITTFIDFLLVAFVMFLIVKGMNRVKKKQEADAATPPELSTQEKLLTEIRDSLKK